MFIEKLKVASFEPYAALLSILGAGLISINTGAQFYGFAAFFLSNILLIAFFYYKRMPWLVLLQCVFLITSVIGLVRHS